MSDTTGAEPPATRPQLQSGRVRHATRTRPRRVSGLSNQHATLIDAALRWALPWSRRGYPGFHRGIQEILQRHITYSAIQHWRVGRRRPPLDLMIMLRHYINARVEPGRQMVTELDREIAKRQAEPHRLAGCCAMRAAGVGPLGLGARGRAMARAAGKPVKVP